MADESTPKRQRRAPAPKPPTIEEAAANLPADFGVVKEPPRSEFRQVLEALGTMDEAGNRARAAMAELASAGIEVITGGTDVRVYMHPPVGPGEDKGEGGVGRVQRGMLRHIPGLEAGVIFVNTPEEADVIALHIACPEGWHQRYADKAFVAHVHGLHWSDVPGWGRWAGRVNAQVLENCRGADVITAPSEWVAHSLRRHLSRDVHAIPHGIEPEEWAPRPGEERLDYVLWDKTRVDPVCDPAPLIAVAERLPDVPFLTTAMEEGAVIPANLTIIGKQPFERAAQLTRRADLYLATVRETFGVSLIQALAAGVPLVGYRWGGAAELEEEAKRIGIGANAIQLVEPGDIDGLAARITGWREAPEDVRGTVRKAAMDFGARFTWDGPASSYALDYHIARNLAHRRNPRASVVITSHNLRKYLPDAIASVAAQEGDDWECVIVDDASTDGSLELARELTANDPRFRVVATQKNLYLAGARNFGVQESKARYILPLDADDMLAPRAVRTLADALDGNRALAIAYGNVAFVREDGSLEDYGRGGGHSGWPMPMEVAQQIQQRNLLPYSSMFRRASWADCGGYREERRTAEDADFWTRLVSYGFRAKMVTTADTLVYRNRDGSMSRREGETRWGDWFGWRARPEIAPAGGNEADLVAAASYDPIAISVIIPVGPGHELAVKAAIDSVEAQDMPHYEVLVMWDSPLPPPPLPAWVTVYGVRRGDSATGSPAAGRNMGAKLARGRWLLYLDADDVLQPGALAVWLRAAGNAPEDIFYSDFWHDGDTPGKYERFNAPDWRPEVILTSGAQACAHVLVPRKVALAVPFREGQIWEDWAFQIDTAAIGVCWHRIAAPLFTYRKHRGTRREALYSEVDANVATFRELMLDYYEGGKNIMACQSCGGGPGSTIVSTSPEAQQLARARGGTEGLVKVHYVGPHDSIQHWRAPSGQTYLAGGDVRIIYAAPVDLEWLEGRGFTAADAVPELEDAARLVGDLR